MPIGSNSQAIGAQVEAIRPKLENLALDASVFWKRINARTDITPVSTRPTRVPFLPIDGGAFRVGNFDGPSLGLGSGPGEVPGYLSCVGFLEAMQYTALADWGTDEEAKSVQNYVALTHEKLATTFGGYMDAALQGPGDNSLGTVVSTVAGGIVVTQANLFQNNQFVDFGTAGVTIALNVQIDTVDIQNNTIWLVNAVPAGVVAGVTAYIQGSSQQPNAGLAGLRAYNVAGNLGSFMGIMRSTYPGMFSTPNVNLNGRALTPATVRAVQSNQMLALGPDRIENSEDVAHCNVDMLNAWENAGINVTQNVYQQIKGDRSEDMLKKRSPDAIAGRPVLLNVRAATGIIDFVCLKEWWRIETRPADLYDVGGQTVFPAYGADGGVASSMLVYMVWLGQVGTSQPRMNAYLNNAAIPAGVFGH